MFHGEPDENGEVEIAYGTEDGYKNGGYITETISGLVQWATANKKIQIIKAETYKTNTPSIRVLEKNNFEIAGQNDVSVIMKLRIKN